MESVLKELLDTKFLVYFNDILFGFSCFASQAYTFKI